MTDRNAASNMNENREMRNQSSDDDEQNSEAGDQVNIARESSHRHQPVTQNSGVGSVQSSTLSAGNRRRVRLGHAQPCSVEYTAGLNQGGQGAALITNPFDELWPRDISEIFSSSVEIYHPSPRVSNGVQDTQPPDMPTPYILNNNRHGPVMDDGDGRLRVDARAHNDPGTNMDVVADNEPIVGNNTMTTAPMEHSHDIDFSVDTLDPHSDNQSDPDSEEDEHRLAAGNVPIIRHDDNLAHANEGQVSPIPAVASFNPENIVRSNQTNLPIDQPIATNSSSPQASDDERNVNNPAGSVGQSRVHTIPTSTLVMPKVRSPADSGDESNEENMT